MAATEAAGGSSLEQVRAMAEESPLVEGREGG